MFRLSPHNCSGPPYNIVNGLGKGIGHAEQHTLVLSVLEYGG